MVATLEHETELGASDGESSTPRCRRSEQALLWLPFGALVVLSFCSTADDPLITLRYAANLLHGHGPVFNPGQRVEGFTSPLHLAVDVALLAAPLGHALLKVKLASLLFGGLAIRQAGRLVRRAPVPTWAMRVGLLVTGGSFILAYSASNGLETSLACWLTTLLVTQLVDGRALARPTTTGLVAGLCVLARPDALLAVVALAACGLVVESTVPLRARVRWVASAAAVVAISEVLRVAYFGAWLPNTFYAKQVPFARGIAKGTVYVITGLAPHIGHGIVGRLGLVALLVAPLTTFGIGVVVVARTRGRMLYLVAAVAAQAAFILKAGGDWITGARFLAPVVPALILLQIVGTVALAADLRAKGPSGLRNARALVCIVVASAFLPALTLHGAIWTSQGRVSDRALMAAGAYPQTPAWIEGAKLLDCAKPGDLVAYSEMGWVSWARHDLHFLDVRGLTDPEIALRAPANIRYPSGVVDDKWASSSSVTGKAIVAQQPQFILVLGDLERPTAIGGRYLPVRKVGSGSLTLVLYRRADVACRLST